MEDEETKKAREIEQWRLRKLIKRLEQAKGKKKLVESIDVELQMHLVKSMMC
jgi:hypothetical protein